MVDDTVTQFPTRATRSDEPFFAEAAHFPYENDEWGTHSPLVVRQSSPSCGFRPSRVRSHVAMIANAVVLRRDSFLRALLSARAIWPIPDLRGVRYAVAQFGDGPQFELAFHDISKVRLSAKHFVRPPNL